jgi:hypothetical protein
VGFGTVRRFIDGKHADPTRQFARLATGRPSTQLVGENIPTVRDGVHGCLLRVTLDALDDTYRLFDARDDDLHAYTSCL